MIFLWILLLPIIPFINYSNCWYYAMWHKIRHNAKIIPMPSKRWSGHHWIWIDSESQAWEYTLTKMPKFTPWYKLVLYKGVVRKFRGRYG